MGQKRKTWDKLIGALSVMGAYVRADYDLVCVPMEYAVSSKAKVSTVPSPKSGNARLPAAAVSLGHAVSLMSPRPTS